MIKTTVLAAALAAALVAQESYDLVVYGGTAGGVITAVSGARHGLKTLLLEPGRHVGGMVTGGLSRTDVGKREVIGGLALEFYYRVGEKYEMNRFNQPVAWFYEPKVGEQVLREMLEQAGVEVRYGRRLREKDGVRKTGARVTEMVLEDGARVAARVFADATYEGDLMAQARVSYTWGREGTAQYGESLAGFRDKTPYHQFLFNVPALDGAGRPLPEVERYQAVTPGTADRRVQAYNFRVIATNKADNRIPWPKPDGYDAARYELLARYLAEFVKQKGRAPVFHEVTLVALIPNGKADLNNNGPFSSDFIGKNYGYPEGTYAQRARIWREHELYQKGFYYFLANDPRTPRALQEEVRTWGLPKDEYTDSGNWPHQLYVREARRITGEYVVIQQDLQTERTKPDVIGMGSYNSDSHNVQRFVNGQGFAENEGDMQVAVQPYQIPYRVMLPKRAEAENLLVPVCFSASHVAYSSLRMEPQYMILGQAAGAAAAQAVRAGAAVQDVSVAELQKTLRAEGAVFEYTENPQAKALEEARKRTARPGPARFNREQ